MRAPEKFAGRARAILALAAGALLVACAPQPEPIAYGQDVGAFCRMVIMDERYGTELVTRTGRVHKFDSVECMAAFLRALEDTASVHSLWVTDYQTPGTLIPLDDAHFLHSSTLRSPMGANLTAFRRDAITEEALVNAFGGRVLTWDEVVTLVEARGPGHAPHPDS